MLEYLGRYTHRVAIGNQRLLALQDGQVSFAWTDYPDFYAKLRLCPKCGIGTMVQLQVLFPCHGPVPMLVDTS